MLSIYRVYTTASYHDQPYRPAVEQGGRGLLDNLLGGGSSRLLMVGGMDGGMGEGMVHGGMALEGMVVEGGKTDLGSKPQSNEQVLVRSLVEDGGGSVPAAEVGFEVWFGWR